MFFCILLTIAAKFDLETIQLNAVNALVYANFDKIMYMQFPPEYEENLENEEKHKIYGDQEKILKLNKALYSFCCSLFLWQKKLTVEMRQLGFEKISQKLCVV